jgi:glycosyltransferase involved in cell wall biosynthesis
MFVIDTLLPGGAEHVLLNLVQGLREMGNYRPVIASLYQPGPLAEKFEKAGVPVHANLSENRYDVQVVPRLMKLIRKERVRIVVAVGSGGNRMFWAALAGKLAGVKVVVWSHTYSQPGHLEFEQFNRVLYPLVDRFVALGRRHAACMAWRDKVPEGRIVCIPNGIVLGRYDYSRWRDRARAVLGLADESIFALGLIANLRPGKRHDIFIEAAKKVVQRNRNVHFFIIGNGPNQANVRKWATQSGLLGAYLSMLGHREDVPTLLPGLDMVCICSEWQECLSLTALQAAAASVPVLSNFVGSMDELITDNQTGFFYKPLSPDALAERILELAANEPLRRQVAENVYGRVERDFTRDRMVADFTRLFDDLLTTNIRFTGELGILSRMLSSRG